MKERVIMSVRVIDDPAGMSHGASKFSEHSVAATHSAWDRGIVSAILTAPTIRRAARLAGHFPVKEENWVQVPAA
jgi:hypothetical protein